MGRRFSFRKLRSRRKLIGIWSVLALFAVGYSLHRLTGFHSVEDYEDFAIRALAIIIWISVVLVPLLLWRVFVLRRRNRAADSGPPSFRNQPWMFDKEFIRLHGRVEKVFRNDPDLVMKRKLVDVVRRIAASGDHTGRHVHQRFLISSALLRKGDNLMVLANLDSDTPRVKEGALVEIQGEYIHSRARQNSKFGKPLTFYGKVHYTHAPLGHVKILERNRVSDLTQVEILPHVKRDYLGAQRHDPKSSR